MRYQQEVTIENSATLGKNQYERKQAKALIYGIQLTCIFAIEG